MGRTVPSFRMLLEGIIEDLSVFRRALRGKTQVEIEPFTSNSIPSLNFLCAYHKNMVFYPFRQTQI
jgi:hypothetical protein